MTDTRNAQQQPDLNELVGLVTRLTAIRTGAVPTDIGKHNPQLIADEFISKLNELLVQNKDNYKSLTKDKKFQDIYNGCLNELAIMGIDKPMSHLLKELLAWNIKPTFSNMVEIRKQHTIVNNLLDYVASSIKNKTINYDALKNKLEVEGYANAQQETFFSSIAQSMKELETQKQNNYTDKDIFDNFYDDLRALEGNYRRIMHHATNPLFDDKNSIEFSIDLTSDTQPGTINQAIFKISNSELSNIKILGSGNDGEVYRCEYLPDPRTDKDDNQTELEKLFIDQQCLTITDSKDKNNKHYYITIKRPLAQSEAFQSEIKTAADLKHKWFADAEKSKKPCPHIVAQGATFFDKQNNPITNILISRLEAYDVEKAHEPQSNNLKEFLEGAKQCELNKDNVDPEKQALYNIFGEDRNINTANLLTHAYHSLTAIHNAGILHRDPALRNVLVTEPMRAKNNDLLGYTAKVVDVGSAKALEEDGRAQEDRRIGPLYWMDHSSLCREKTTAISDLYAFRIMLFEAMAIELGVDLGVVLNPPNMDPNILGHNVEVAKMLGHNVEVAKFVMTVGNKKALETYVKNVATLIKQSNNPKLETLFNSFAPYITNIPTMYDNTNPDATNAALQENSQIFAVNDPTQIEAARKADQALLNTSIQAYFFQTLTDKLANLDVKHPESFLISLQRLMALAATINIDTALQKEREEIREELEINDNQNAKTADENAQRHQLMYLRCKELQDKIIQNKNITTNDLKELKSLTPFPVLEKINSELADLIVIHKKLSDEYNNLITKRDQGNPLSLTDFHMFDGLDAIKFFHNNIYKLQEKLRTVQNLDFSRAPLEGTRGKLDAFLKEIDNGPTKNWMDLKNDILNQEYQKLEKEITELQTTADNFIKNIQNQPSKEFTPIGFAYGLHLISQRQNIISRQKAIALQLSFLGQDKKEYLKKQDSLDSMEKEVNKEKEKVWKANAKRKRCKPIWKEFREKLDLATASVTPNEAKYMPDVSVVLYAESPSVTFVKDLNELLDTLPPEINRTNLDEIQKYFSTYSPASSSKSPLEMQQQWKELQGIVEKLKNDLTLLENDPKGPKKLKAIIAMSTLYGVPISNILSLDPDNLKLFDKHSVKYLDTLHNSIKKLNEQAAQLIAPTDQPKDKPILTSNVLTSPSKSPTRPRAKHVSESDSDLVFTQNTLNILSLAITNKNDPDHRGILYFVSNPNNKKFLLDKKNVHLRQTFENAYNNSVTTFADSLIALDKSHFDKIDTNELFNKSGAQTPTLTAFSNFYNKVSFYVIDDIIHQQKDDDRALALEYWINVADKCLNHPNLKSLNMAMAIMAAFENAAIARLKATHASLSENALKKLDKLKSQLDTSNNYSKLRSFMDMNPDAIPYIGLYQTDFTFTRDGNQTAITTTGLKSNALLYKIQQQIRQFQKNVAEKKWDNAPTDLDNLPIQQLLKVTTFDKEKQQAWETVTYNTSLELERRDMPMPSEKQIESRITNQIEGIIYQQQPSTSKSRAIAHVRTGADDKTYIIEEKNAWFIKHLQKIGKNNNFGVISKESTSPNESFVRGNTLDEIVANSGKPIKEDDIISWEKYANDLFDSLQKQDGKPPITLIDEPPLKKALAAVFLMLQQDKKDDFFADPQTVSVKNNLEFVKCFISELRGDERTKFIGVVEANNIESQLPKAIQTHIDALKNNFFQQHPDKIKLSKKLPRDMDKYEKVGEKPGGRNEAGEHGAVYAWPYVAPPKNQDEIKNTEVAHQQYLLFKQEPNQHKNIAEFVVSRIENKLIGDSAATVILATRPSENGEAIKLPDETGKNVYVGSVFFDNFTEIFKKMGYEKRKPFFEATHGKEYLNTLAKKNTNGKYECRFDDLSKTLVACLLAGDFDVHSGNLGVVPGGSKGKEGIIKKIDHAAGLYHLEDELHPFSSTDHRIDQGPTNHFRDFHRDLIVNAEFADELIKQSKEDLTKEINDAIDEAAKFYNAQPLAEFAQYLGMNVEKELQDLKNANIEEKKTIKDNLVKNIKNFLDQKMKNRQQSLAEFAAEIKLSISIEKQKGRFEFVKNKAGNKDMIDDLIAEDPFYFLKGKYHFRSADQQINIQFTETVRRKIGSHKAELTEKVNKRVHDRLGDILAQANAKQDPRIIEYIFANKEFRKKLPGLNNNYSTLLVNISNALTSYSRELYLGLPEKKQEMLNAAHNLSQKVLSDIVAEKSIGHRTLVVKRWIALMKLAHEKNDLHTASAIYDGLAKAEPCLKNTFKGLADDEKTFLQQAKDTSRDLVKANETAMAKDKLAIPRIDSIEATKITAHIQTQRAQTHPTATTPFISLATLTATPVANPFPNDVLTRMASEDQKQQPAKKFKKPLVNLAEVGTKKIEVPPVQAKGAKKDKTPPAAPESNLEVLLKGNIVLLEQMIGQLQQVQTKMAAIKHIYATQHSTMFHGVSHASNDLVVDKPNNKVSRN